MGLQGNWAGSGDIEHLEGQEGLCRALGDSATCQGQQTWGGGREGVSFRVRGARIAPFSPGLTFLPS